MCGIFFYLGQIDQRIFKEFMKSQSRGPNNSHVMIEDNMFFGFHRLMINDLTYNGDQPMTINQNILMCNGEIYNYKDIIKKYDLQCKSSSDCEVIVQLYNNLKNNSSASHEEIVNILCKELDGEFAFIIYDKTLHKLIAARDRYGVRPLFFGKNSKGSMALASELKNIDALEDTVSQFPPSTFAIFNMNDIDDNIFEIYNNISEPYDINNDNVEEILPKIREALENAVEKRMMADPSVEICALLSGGLDSSLVCAILAKKMTNKLHTYSIGMEGSTDLKYAKIVADHIGSIHHEVLVTPQEMLDTIEEVIRVIESYDITTVRASTPHYLIAKYIKSSSAHRVVYSGELQDELGSYLYFKNAPDDDAFHNEANRLLQDVCYFDNLRADRCISVHGLEARIPFSDVTYIKLNQSLNPKLRTCDNKIEKFMLRKAFDGINLLPDSVLYRQKDGFSDSVSNREKSWYQIVQEFVETKITDEEFITEKIKYTHCTPHTKEAYYYRKVFNAYYRHNSVIPYFWMPKWSNTMDPSARTLKDVYVYN